MNGTTLVGQTFQLLFDPGLNLFKLDIMISCETNIVNIKNEKEYEVTSYVEVEILIRFVFTRPSIVR